MLRTLIIFTALICTVLAQPGIPGSSESKKGFETGIAARVNRDVITNAEVWAALGANAVAASEAEQNETFKAQLAIMVEGLLTDQEASRIGLSINDDWLERVVEREKADLGGENAYRQMLLELGRSAEEHREALRTREKIHAFMRARGGLGAIGKVLRSEHVLEPTIEEVRAAYLASRDEVFTREKRVRVRAIALSKRRLENSEGSEEAALAFAQKMVEDLKTGADFSLLANRHSAFEARRDEKDKKGGDFGYLSEGAQVNEFLLEQAFSAPVAEVVGPLDNGSFLWIVRVEEREEARVLAFEEVAVSIKDRLRGRRLDRALKEVKLELAQQAFITPVEVKRLLVDRLRASLLRSR